MLFKKKQASLLALACAMAFPAYGFESFTVKDIRLEGLQRISLGTVFNYLPVKVGDEFTDDLSSASIRALYKTGSFKNISFEREDNVLIIFVAERPAISDIKFSGNNEIPTESLEDVLKQIGLVKGRVFDPSVLERMQQELKRQYYSLGKYSIKVEADITPLERNRVDIEIKIAEGDAAEIYAINIVGNKIFSNETLLNQLELAGSGFFGGKKQYSKQQISGDLETLKSYYLDRGYINFTINSTLVSLTPDKKDIYITVNITEGNSYTVRKIDFVGDLILDERTLRDLVTIQPGNVFSRKLTAQSRNNITDKLATLGYAFSNVNVVPDVDEDSKTVALSMYVDPGRRVYVRRININGNDRTRDEVIRREIRQMEGGWLTTEKIAQSRRRLNRLGYFETVGVETPTVAGVNDQVDVNYSISERATGQITAGLGYSDTQKLIVNFGLSQDNFAGTGKRVAIKVDNSAVVKLYSLNFTNPYYTIDGISRGFTVYYRKVNAAEADISSYDTDSLGASLSFGIPLTEQQFLNFSTGYEDTNLIAGVDSSQTIKDFITRHGNQYDTYSLTTSWRYDSRDKAVFPNDGQLTRLSSEIAVPGGDLQYYKFNLRSQHYFSLWNHWTLLFNANLGYGDGYNDTQQLPPFKTYYAGGSRSVRGYKSASLGGTNTKDPITNDPIGGSTKIVTNLELYLPQSDSKMGSGLRFGVFFDSGYVYADEDSIKLSEMRSSVGISAIWLAPIGTLRFSLANPINDTADDRTQIFQFTLGSGF